MMRPIATVALLTLALAACALDRTEGPRTAAPASARNPARAVGMKPIIETYPPHASRVAGNPAGAWLGSQLGKALEPGDRSKMQDATQQALEKARTGTTLGWSNPATGHSGTITPQQPFRNGAGQTCREYHQTVSAAGRTETGYGSACRQGDGVWRAVSKG